MEGFTVAMALVDAIPVLLFGGSMAVIAARFGSPLFIAGAVLCIIAGLCKVIWKLLLGLKKGNVRWLNRLFVPCMAGGFLMLALAVILNVKLIPWNGLFHDILALPSVIFFALGLAGLLLMGLLSAQFKREDARANWRAQIVNAAAQASILLGILFTK